MTSDCPVPWLSQQDATHLSPPSQLQSSESNSSLYLASLCQLYTVCPHALPEIIGLNVLDRNISPLLWDHSQAGWILFTLDFVWLNTSLVGGRQVRNINKTHHYFSFISAEWKKNPGWTVDWNFSPDTNCLLVSRENSLLLIKIFCFRFLEFSNKQIQWLICRKKVYQIYLLSVQVRREI